MNPLKVGNVVHVDSTGIEVLITAPDLNLEHEGQTYRVGQLGSYITIPMNERTLVGFVTGTGRRDVAVGDVTPRILVQIQLLGEIRGGRFARGVYEYPIVGDDVWVAVQSDFDAIFGSFDQLLAGSDHPQSFVLGTFCLNPDYDVKVLGTELLAKHVAVVGNSGSGKSCTTAKILHELTDLQQSQVILFDMHGEYRAAFSDEDGQLNANVTYLGADDLVLPYWLLKYEEIEELFVDRSNPLHVSTQISFLRTALLEFKQSAAAELGLTQSLTLDTPIYFSLDHLKTYAENLNDARFVLNDDHLAFSQLSLRSLHIEEQQTLMRRQRCQFNRGNPEGETPHPLYFGKLLGFIDQIDTRFQDRRYEFLLRPILHGLKSRYFRDHIDGRDAPEQRSQLMNHLIKVLTGRVEPRSNLTIVDLSGIPFEIIDVTVAVLTRLLFDLNFWTPAQDRHPTLLVFEEAHNYIPRVQLGKSFAKKAVERVAKEGRKYGVSAMIISQRPSELSETVLAQCNSFIVMRLSNPEDQKYVAKVVGDHFAGVIQMLPSLRPGEAFVIGDSVLMPMRTQVEMPSPPPRSSNLDFFQIWSSNLAHGDVDQVIGHWQKQDRRFLDDPNAQQGPGFDKTPLPNDPPAEKQKPQQTQEIPQPNRPAPLPVGAAAGLTRGPGGTLRRPLAAAPPAAARNRSKWLAKPPD